MVAETEGGSIFKIDLTNPLEYTVLGRDDSLTLFNSKSSGGFGEAIATGDLDGDGTDDIAIGVPTSDMYNGGGLVMVYFSRDPDEMSPLYGHVDCDMLIYGSNKDDKLGTALHIADLNNDGMSELIMGAPYADGMNNERRNSGDVYILEGRERSQFKPVFDVDMVPLFGRIYGRDTGDMLGMDIITADLTGDGAPEVVIRDEGSGGRAGSESENHNECIGSWEIEVIQGDITGIGTIDIHVSGSYFRFFGQYSNLDDVYATHIGNGLASGDMNGDGHDDLVFTYRFLGNGYVAVIEGGPAFPPIAPGYTSSVHNGPFFEPMFSINLWTEAFEEASVCLGSLDDDGMDDLVVGIPYAPGSDLFRRFAGQVDVYLGRMKNTSGAGVGPGLLNLNRLDANLTILGIDSSDRFGTDVMIMDSDGDQENEIMITAPYADGIDNMEFDVGEAYVFEMVDNTSDMDLTDARDIYIGGQSASGAFTSLAKLQYLDDDPEEILIGSPGFVSQKGGEELVGMVSMFSQRKAFDAIFIGQYDSSLFGTTTLMDDFNQDGFFDIAVGDPIGYPGRIGNVDLFFGDGDGWSGRKLAENSANISYHNAEDNSYLGDAIASGDLNNDGFPDLVIGAPRAGVGGYWNDAGEIRIYWGDSKGNMSSKPNRRIVGTSVERIGSAIIVDDLNNDGIDDLVYSAPYDPGSETKGRYHAGVVFIIFGPIQRSGGQMASSTSRDVKIIGSIPSEFIGESLSSGDIDGDGLSDLIIGAPSSSRGSVDRQGLVYVLKGREIWPSAIDLLNGDALKIFGPWPYDSAGSKICSGDIDGDGKDEMAIGAMTGDGYQRSVPEGGNTYVLKGEFMASNMPNGTLMLRTQSNATISGDEKNMLVGSGLSIGDITGDGREDLMIGAYGWKDPVSGFQTGAVLVFSSELFKDHQELNATSLPVISGFSDQDRAGVSVFSRDINGDGLVDLLVGAPGADPLMEGNDPGAVYYWEGKDLFYRPYKASLLQIEGGSVVAGDLGRVETILEPLEGPYSMMFSARSKTGYEDIRFIEMEILNTSLPGSAIIRANTATGEISLDATGEYKGRVILHENESSSYNDGIQTWFVDFRVQLNWSFPDSDTILTRVRTDSISDTNYLTRPFMVDHLVKLDTASIDLEIQDDSRGNQWLNSSSVFSLDGIMLEHGTTNDPISDNSSQMMVFSVYRPDGLRIGSAAANGSRLHFTNMTPGEGLGSKDIMFSISPSAIPEGAIWKENSTFTLDVDTHQPPPVSSFIIYPDGKESMSRAFDDDETVELFWTPVNDQGGSGISYYELTIIDMEGSRTILTEQEPGDLIILPRGNVTLSLLAVDKAGNRGICTNFTINIDVGDPAFTDPFPPENSWINVETNSFSVLVVDQGSGIDPTMAFYRVYRSDVNLLSDWIQVRSMKLNPDGSILLNATVPEANGYGNYIQWKVTDNVGITSISSSYLYSMDIDAPKIEIETREFFISPMEFEIEAYMEDILSGLQLSSISYRIASQEEFYGRGWTSLGYDGVGASQQATVSVLPAFRGWGFAQWRVMDNAGNWVESDLVSIFIDDVFPQFMGFTPNGSSVIRKSLVSVSLDIREDESGLGPGDIEYSISTMSGWIEYGVGGYSPWMTVQDVVDNGFGTYTATVEVRIDEGPLNRLRFRARDRAGNGWAISPTLMLERETTVQNLPPTAIFTLIPAVDTIKSGETILVDASTSSDPEGENLTYRWYSDLEDFPSSELIGTGMVMNTTLEKIGVHRIWLEVSDGDNNVVSEEIHLRVMEEEADKTEESDPGRDILDIAGDAIFLLILVLLIGILIGGFVAYKLIEGQEKEEQEPRDNGPWVDAKYEPDYAVPFCPYCDSEARSSDEFCMTCGQVFTPEDKERMEKEMKKGKKKKRKHKRDLLPHLEEPVGPPDEDPDQDEEPIPQDGDAYEDNPFLEETEPPSEEEIIEEIDEEEFEDYDDIEDYDDLEEIEDMEDVEDLDMEDEWEVDE